MQSSEKFDLNKRLCIQQTCWVQKILGPEKMALKEFVSKKILSLKSHQDSVHIFQKRFLRWNHELKQVGLSNMKPKNRWFFSCKDKATIFLQPISMIKSNQKMHHCIKNVDFVHIWEGLPGYPKNYYQSFKGPWKYII